MQNSYIEPPVRPLMTEQLSFLAIINFVLRHLGLMRILGVIASTIFVVKVIRSPRTYSSSSIVSTGDEISGNRITALLGGGSLFSNPGVQFYVDLIGAPVVLEPLARVPFDFPTGKKTAVEFYGGKLPPDRALESA